MLDPKDPDAAAKMRDMFGPGQVDQQVRSAIQFCWMMLPDNEKTLDALEREIRRIFERAIKALREDAEAFGLGR